MEHLELLAQVVLLLLQPPVLLPHQLLLPPDGLCDSVCRQPTEFAIHGENLRRVRNN